MAHRLHSRPDPGCVASSRIDLQLVRTSDETLPVIAALFMTYAGVALFNSVNALRRPVEPGSRFPPLWLPGMIVSELTTTLLVSRIVVAAFFIALGVLRHPAGWLALMLVGIAQLLLLPQYGRTAAALREAAGPLPSRSGTTRARITGRLDLPPDLELVQGVEYHRGLTLDLYRKPGLGAPAPTLIYVHGGGWRGGDPHGAGRPLFHALADDGWIVATIRYPLSPAATFPDHAIGVKRAIAWAKSQGPAYGIDPQRIALCGGSAGGHLAALAALTPDRPELQPGFEDVDTSVIACVPLYGIFDFFNRHKTRWDWPLIPRIVMKARPEEDPDRYRLASPIDQIGPHAPPFLVIHGSNDSLVPPREAEVFVEALRRGSSRRVEYLEVPGAQHAFDAIASTRTRAVVTRIAAFLDDVLASAHA